VLVPMLMLLGISPETTTAAYRVGDSATNIITPLMVYFPLILIFCQRWQKDFGLGSLAAMMLPYSIGLMIAGTRPVPRKAGRCSRYCRSPATPRSGSIAD
jgi:aminobenzoyl-glutamate transport protein